MYQKSHLSIQMKVTAIRRIGFLALVTVGALVTLAILLFWLTFAPQSAEAAPDLCGSSPWTANSEATLNSAIACHNSTTSGPSEIHLSQDIALTADTTIISNVHTALTIVGNGHVLNGSDQYRPLTLNGGDVTLQNLTLTHGNHNSSGGGIYALNIPGGYEADQILQRNQDTPDLTGLPTLLITGSQISSNSATFFGGGLYAKGYDVQIANSALTDNSTTNGSSSGGAIYVSYAHLHLANSTLAGNQSAYFGGGIHAAYYPGTMRLTNNVLENNLTGRYGGAFYGTSATDLTMTGNVISGNQVTYSGSSYGGGGLTLFYSEGAIITDNQFINNQAYVGGGIQLSGYNINHQIADNLFERNHAAGEGGGVWLQETYHTQIAQNTILSNTTAGAGGGLKAYNTDHLTITRNTIEHNESQSGSGGGLWLHTMNNSSIDQNVIARNKAFNVGGGFVLERGENNVVAQNGIYLNDATYKGGGIYINREGDAVTGYTQLVNNTISQNSSTAGGAIYITKLTLLEITHNTIASNTTAITESAIYIDPDAVTNQIDLSRSIIAHANGMNCNTAPQTASQNIDTDGSCDVSGSSLVSDPLLHPLADNGGRSWTHAISSDSPAVDTGDPSTISEDQRAIARPQGQAPDIGAYELEGAAVEIELTADSLSLDWSAVGDSCDGLIYNSDTPFGSYTLLTTLTSGEASADLNLSADTNSYYYLDLENCAGGTDLAPSNSVGSFNFALDNG